MIESKTCPHDSMEAHRQGNLREQRQEGSD